MDKIKPHHWITQVGVMYRRKPPKQSKPLAYYDQSAIDALRAEVDRLQGLLKSAPVVRIGGADGLSCFIEKFGKNSLPSMHGQSVALVSVDAMKVVAP